MTLMDKHSGRVQDTHRGPPSCLPAPGRVSHSCVNTRVQADHFTHSGAGSGSRAVWKRSQKKWSLNYPEGSRQWKLWLGKLTGVSPGAPRPVQIPLEGWRGVPSAVSRSSAVALGLHLAHPTQGCRELPTGHPHTPASQTFCSAHPRPLLSSAPPSLFPNLSP